MAAGADGAVAPLPGFLTSDGARAKLRAAGFLQWNYPVERLLHFADNPMQQAGSDHLVAAKLHCNVLKEGIAVGRCYRLGGLHQPVEFVRAQSQSQLVHWGHGELHTENGGMRQPEFGFNV